MFVSLNGKLVPEKKAVVSVFDRSFLYGDGLFETVCVFNGRPFRWEQHMERLRQGAKFLGIKLPFKAIQLLEFAQKLVAKNKLPDSFLRLTLSRGVGAHGYTPRDANRPTLVMSLRPAPEIGRNVVWKLVTSSFRLPSHQPLAWFKTCNKLPQVLARAEANAAGADEALLLNTDGFVVEGASSNLFWIEQGTLCTPPLAAGILSGITRAVVFEIAKKLKLPVREKNIRLKELAQAEGIFLSLSSFGIIEAITLDGRKIKKSPVVRQIASAYQDILTNSSACKSSSEP